jgi:hypothetical protein
MKKIILNCLISSLGFLFIISSCTKRPTDDITPTDNSFNNFFSNQRNERQTFTLNSDVDNVITGANGTKVYIGGGTLRNQSGEQITGNVTITLKEVFELSDMILNNATTMANGQILTSGGEVYVSATQYGQELTLDNNASFFISIPAPNGTTDSMNVFIGEDSSGVITWEPVNADTVNSNITLPIVPSQTSLDSTAYYKNIDWAIVNQMNQYVVRSNKFGWINCDYFYSFQNTCSVTTTCDTIYKTPYTKVYFAIPATNSTGYLYVNAQSNFYIPEIPDATALKIVAINYSGGKYHVCITDHIVNCNLNNNNVHLNFIEIEESQLETYISQINI